MRTEDEGREEADAEPCAKRKFLSRARRHNLKGGMAAAPTGPLP
jgi:hypothetical protein